MAQRVFLGILFAVMLVPFTIFVWAVQELRATYRLKKALEEKPDPSTTDRAQNNPPASNLGQEPSLQTGGDPIVRKPVTSLDSETKPKIRFIAASSNERTGIPS